MLTRKQKAALKRLETKKDGKPILYPTDVVEAARDPKSPLHSRFEWDDGEAAEKWRLEQARVLIRVYVHVIADPQTNKVVRIRNYAHLRNDGAGYRPIQTIAASRSTREAYLQQFASDLEALRRQYESAERIMRSPEIFKAIDRFLASVKEAMEKPARRTRAAQPAGRTAA
jgi:hypothetical protein